MNRNEEKRLALCESALRVLLTYRYTTQNKFRWEMKKLHPMNNEVLFNAWLLTIRADLKEGGLIEEDGCLVKLTSKGRAAAENGGYKAWIEGEYKAHKRRKRLPFLSFLTDASMLIVSIIGLLTQERIFTCDATPFVLSFIAGVATNGLWHSLKRRRKRYGIQNKPQK